jgi:ABC-type polysaccharide/polyol phosphate transport system ATPase subunit
MDQIGKMCQRVAWLNKGKIELEGDPATVIPRYTGM